MNKHTQHRDAWKELAEHSFKPQARATSAGNTLRYLVTYMNERSPFSSASSVFDNGCGSGSVISHILDDYGSKIPSSATILAADFSEPMLDTLREKRQVNVSAGKPGWDRLEVRNLDAHDLSVIPDGSISHVTGGHLYFLLADPPLALKESQRILAPRGILALSSGKESQHLDAIRDAVESIRPNSNLRLLQEPWNSEASITKLLRDAGFTGVETFLVDEELSYTRHSDIAKVLLMMPVMKIATEDYEDNERDKLLVELTEQLGKRNPSQPGKLKGISIIALARRA